jgi:ATP-binding cassette, subfamily B, bacterial HlyB/CyaB
MLFTGSVRDNIALTDPAMAVERILVAARLAGAHDFIARLPQGYDSVVGERGTALSGGQRQRLAIARALATDPRILVLDEATSALDVDSEKAIRDNLMRIKAGRATVIIAHWLNTVLACDRILVLSEGRIVEDGAPKALMAQGGVFAGMMRGQG